MSSTHSSSPINIPQVEDSVIESFKSLTTEGPITLEEFSDYVEDLKDFSFETHDMLTGIMMHNGWKNFPMGKQTFQEIFEISLILLNDLECLMGYAKQYDENSD